MVKKALFIINPVSGEIENRDELIKNITEEIPGYDVTVWETTGEDDERRITEKVKSNSFELILVGGGDGTIKMVATQILDLEIPILPIPFGSANGLSACLGIFDWEDSIKALKVGQPIKMDILDVNGETCLHLCDFGFNAALIKRFEERDERGMGAYFKSSVAQVFENNQFRFRLEINGEKSNVNAKMLVVANGEMYGTGAKINPTGKKDDGKFEIIALNPDSFKEWAKLTMGFIRGDFSDLDFVQTFSCDRVVIENIDGAEFHIDGELKTRDERVEVSINKEKIGFYTNIP